MSARPTSTTLTNGVMLSRPEGDPVEPCESCGTVIGPVTTSLLDGRTRTEWWEDPRVDRRRSKVHTPERCRDLRA